MNDKIKKIADSLQSILGILMLAVMMSFFGPLFFPKYTETTTIISITAFMYVVVRLHMIGHRLKSHKPSSVELLREAQRMRGYEKSLAEISKVQWKEVPVPFREWSKAQKVTQVLFILIPSALVILSVLSVLTEDLVFNLNKLIIIVPVALCYLGAYFWYFMFSSKSVKVDYEDDDEWPSLIQDLSDKIQ